ncbi:MAG: hypothetical protein NVSMB65_03380 [Chloroflexota bacterium]
MMAIRGTNTLRRRKGGAGSGAVDVAADVMASILSLRPLWTARRGMAETERSCYTRGEEETEFLFTDIMNRNSVSVKGRF